MISMNLEILEETTLYFSYDGWATLYIYSHSDSLQY